METRQEYDIIQDAGRDSVTSTGFHVLLEKVVAFYHKAFYGNGRGLRFLKKICLDDSHLLEAFQIGICDESLLNVLSPDDPKVNDLMAAGVIERRDDKLIEKFHDCIVLPVSDHEGAVIGLHGRTMRSGAEKSHFLPGVQSSLWNMAAAKSYSELYLCRDIIDGLSLIRAGYPNVIACSGQSPSQADVELLFNLGVQRINCTAINEDWTPKVMFSRFQVVRVKMPGRTSLNEVLCNNGPEKLSCHIDELVGKAVIEKTKALDAMPSQSEDGFAVNFGQRKYVLRGIEKSSRKLRVTIRIEYHGKFHVDTVDLYNARARKTVCQDIARIFEETAGNVESDVTRLVKLAEDYKPRDLNIPSAPTLILTESERTEAEAFGRCSNMITTILSDFDFCGLVGEQTNKLISYLAATSRKMDDPLSLLILSSSGAGKSALQDVTLGFCPPEDLVKLTSLTGKALFYKGRKSLKHKILAVEEGAGAEDASYAIRNLVSAKELVIEATIKDFSTGRMTTMENKVEGPTAVFITTTDPDVDPETRSRFFVLSVDESREQTRRILAFQRKKQTLDGISRKESVDGIVRKHRNFQRLLKPLAVINPYAEELEYHDDRLQSRRDHPKYLNLIRTVTFLRQMQKTVKQAADIGGLNSVVSFVEVDREDIRIADELCHELLHGNMDDLNGVSYALLLQLDRMVDERVAMMKQHADETIPAKSEILFTRRQIREFTGWSHMRVRRYIKQLIELEFLVVESSKHGLAQRYKLAADETWKDRQILKLLK